MPHESDHQLPDIKEQGKNLAKFTFEVVKDTVSLSKPLFVSKDMHKERLEECDKCKYYEKKQKRCKLCGCFMEYKAKFSSSSCPDNKW